LAEKLVKFAERLDGKRAGWFREHLEGARSAAPDKRISPPHILPAEPFQNLPTAQFPHHFFPGNVSRNVRPVYNDECYHETHTRFPTIWPAMRNATNVAVPSRGACRIEIAM
jgi:hypothetical protein